MLVEASGSTDGTAAVARDWSRRWPVVRLLPGGARLGLFAALERLIAEARGSVVVRIDADVVVEPASIDALVRALAPSSVGIAGPRIAPLQSGSAWVSAASRAEWGLHHEVSRIHPKTTVVQAFRRPLEPVRIGGRLEDAALQLEIERSGLAAVYVPGARVWIAPPSTVRGFLAQRLRTIRIIRRYVRTGNTAPATASMRVVGAALLAALRGRQIRPIDLLVFGTLEVGARVVAQVIPAEVTTRTGIWEPIEGTKEPSVAGHRAASPRGRN